MGALSQTLGFALEAIAVAAAASVDKVFAATHRQVVEPTEDDVVAIVGVVHVVADDAALHDHAAGRGLPGDGQAAVMDLDRPFDDAADAEDDGARTLDVDARLQRSRPFSGEPRPCSGSWCTAGDPALPPIPAGVFDHGQLDSWAWCTSHRELDSAALSFISAPKDALFPVRGGTDVFHPPRHLPPA